MFTRSTTYSSNQCTTEPSTHLHSQPIMYTHILVVSQSAKKHHSTSHPHSHTHTHAISVLLNHPRICTKTPKLQNSQSSTLTSWYSANQQKNTISAAIHTHIHSHNQCTTAWPPNHPDSTLSQSVNHWAYWQSISEPSKQQQHPHWHTQPILCLIHHCLSISV